LELPHKQEFYMLLYVEKAEGVVLLDSDTIRLDESKVVCIKPNSVFRLDINRAAKGFVVCFAELFFSLRYNNNVLYQFSFLKKEAVPYSRLTAGQRERWNTILLLMEDEARYRRKGGDKVLRSYLNILLYELDRSFHGHVMPEKSDAKGDKIILFEKLLEDNYINQKKPSFYAKRLNITTNYLNKLCHDYMNATSGDIIRKRVTVEAQRLLYYTSLNVAEVAYKLGFESSSYFVTFFKKNTGTTPERFRKDSR
jgi:AraC family transcriptional regulator, transcriptional activator of pobA